LFIEVNKGSQLNFVAAFNRNCLVKKKSLVIVCTYKQTLSIGDNNNDYSLNGSMTLSVTGEVSGVRLTQMLGIWQIIYNAHGSLLIGLWPTASTLKVSTK
jgi:hypothetical protein